ncbi:MAG: hypothetical protein WD512_16450 [Candidatus Paceibacterota bacterium]
MINPGKNIKTDSPHVDLGGSSFSRSHTLQERTMSQFTGIARVSGIINGETGSGPINDFSRFAK